MGDELDPRQALAPTGFIDSDHHDVRDFTESVVRGVQDPRERVGLLFAEVRDRLRYDPYSVTAAPRPTAPARSLTVAPPGASRRRCCSRRACALRGSRPYWGSPMSATTSTARRCWS